MFISDLNFRSTKSASRTLAANALPIHWPAISTPNFNSFGQVGRTVMGIISNQPISGFRSQIGNAPFHAKSPIFVSSLVDFNPFPADSFKLATGSGSSAPSSATATAPTDLRRVHSAESNGLHQRVNGPLNSSEFLHAPGKSVSGSLPISFKDVLTPPSPHTAKKSFDDVRNATTKLHAPTYVSYSLMQSSLP